MRKYPELSKKYDDVRSYMRRFYVYGFERKREYNEKSIRSYDDERRRIECWLDNYMYFNTDSNGVTHYISIDTSSICHNPLYKSWKAKSFTSNDIMLHFYLLDILMDGKAYGVAEMLEFLVDRYLNCFSCNINQPDESTVRSKLEEYAELGLLEVVRQGRKKLYRLVQDDIILSDWQTACSFFSETAPLGEIGSFILDKFSNNDNIFLFKHHFILYTLDSNILLDLLEAMNKQRTVKICCIDKNFSDRQTHYVCPLKIYCSTQTGRRYLLNYNYDYKKFMFNRLDRILKLEIQRPEEKYIKFCRIAERKAKYIWGVGLPLKRRLEHITFTIHAAVDEQFIVQRLQREKRCGRVQNLDEESYRFEAEVYDTHELLPWIRTFIGRIKEFTCSNERVKQIFKNDLLQMAAYYLPEDIINGK